MKATVSVGFKGVVDGELYPKDFKAGDTVEGELAKVAVANKWAEEAKGGDKGPKPPGGPASIPEGWELLNAADSIALAVKIGADPEAVKVKAAAQDFIKAEVAKRDEAAKG